jgi:hypothetical protein
MAPLPPYINSLIPREEEQLSDPYLSSIQTRSTELSPPQAHDLLKRSSAFFKRDGTTHTNFIPGQGSQPPTNFNNQAFLALFATLGGLMVLASLWFFFWAKNGGFQWQEDDWDDYKSTVLRRKGPDGKTLSNATKSTKLGGMSIAGTQQFKWARQAAKSVVSYDEKGRKGIMGKRGWGKSHSVTYSDNFTDSLGTQTVSDMTEVRGEPDYQPSHSKHHRDRDVHEYKKERPARVGGLNRVADGSGIGTSTNGSDLYSQSSEQPILHANNAKDKERAERRAREEAAKMERRWKREAEEAAAALARESARSIPQPKKAATPSTSKSTPSSPPKQRQASRSNSPKKRDFSYSAGAAGAASEVMSTAYTGTGSSGQRTASYYDAYRPRAASNPRYESEYTANRTRQSSPQKKKASRATAGGYRRGADSDLD